MTTDKLSTAVSTSQEVLRHLAVPSRASFDKAAEEAEDQRLAAAANFSAEQKRVLVALRAALYTNLGRLQRRREKLTAELQVSLASAWPCVALQGTTEVLQRAVAAACAHGILPWNLTTRCLALQHSAAQGPHTIHSHAHAPTVGAASC